MTRRTLLACVAGAGAVVALGAPGAGASSAVSVKIGLGSAANEFALTASAHSVRAGKVTFVVHDGGKLAHEFVIIKTATPAAKLPMHGAKADEKGAVAEIEEFAPGLTKRLTVTLKPGHYVLLCNVAGHYVGGQHLDFKVASSSV